MVCILTACALHHISHLSNRGWSSHSSPLQIHDLNQVHVASLLLLQGEGAFSCCYLSMTFLSLIKNNTAHRYLKLERCFLTIPFIAFCERFFFSKHIFMNKSLACKENFCWKGFAVNCKKVISCPLFLRSYFYQEYFLLWLSISE